MMDSDIQISSGSSSSSSSNCSGSGSDDELIGKETSGSSSFTSSAGNSQDSAGCTNHASPSGNGVRILPPSSMTHGTSASPLHGPSDPVDMTGNEIGEDKNSERLIYQDALQNLNQPRTEVDLPPGTLSVPLMRHQKIALAWMLRKETTCLDCSGGILAADQGLGKTVSMIALILKQKYESQLKSEITSKQESEILDLDADDDESENAKHDESESHARPPKLKDGSSDMENAKDEEARQELTSNKRPAAGTLVVCPASVVTQWARELDEKVSDESKLSVLVYHGGNRTKDPSVLAKYDVVITTYAIVTNEVPKQFLVDEDENDESHSFSNILDEAQTIKNHRTQVARACCILRAKRRWCLSGAPIQNTVDDLYSYFRFLRYNPYDVYKSFYLGIKAPISRNEKHGYKKLQAVLRAVMLRRTKRALLDGQPLINLPPKKVNLNKVEFSVEELSFYKKLEAESRSRFKAYAAAGTLNQNYTNILLMLLRLRQACDHPQLVHRSTSDPYGKESEEAVQRLSKEARINLLSRLESSSAICNICNDPPEHPVVTLCGHVFCYQCISEHISGDENICPVRAHEGDNFTVVEPPSQEPIKTLVFSQWNGILGINLCFIENGIEFRRLDGTMSLAARDKAVEEFSNDPDVEVILMSLKAGNLGLNMVAASHDRMLFLQEEKRRMVAFAYGEDHGGSSATRLTVDDLNGNHPHLLLAKQHEGTSYVHTKELSQYIDVSKTDVKPASCWQKTLHKIFVGIEANPMMFTKKLMFLRGQVDPVVFIKKLSKAKIYAMLYRIDYGHEENPQGIRKPNNHFLRFRFEIDMLEGSWYKKIIGALKTIQGVSFTIDAPSQMVYMCGNIEEGLFMKMLTKTGIQILGVDYGNLKPPPKKVEAQISDGTKTQPKKDTAPPQNTKPKTRNQGNIFFY
ncbi:BnaA01g25700D [Brassica napus]|uniref:BnaA01g25700D protein n=1 Tax=Brassica napus TaxID=3708 RepID=A0A078HUN1_BRANA|nr:BnaA01g25700D [Brassica napus]